VRLSKLAQFRPSRLPPCAATWAAIGGHHLHLAQRPSETESGKAMRSGLILSIALGLAQTAPSAAHKCTAAHRRFIIGRSLWRRRRHRATPMGSKPKEQEIHRERNRIASRTVSHVFGCNDHETLSHRLIDPGSRGAVLRARRIGCRRLSTWAFRTFPARRAEPSRQASTAIGSRRPFCSPFPNTWKDWPTAHSLIRVVVRRQPSRAPIWPVLAPLTPSAHGRDC
jgi:hypothetical protein